MTLGSPDISSSTAKIKKEGENKARGGAAIERKLSSLLEMP